MTITRLMAMLACGAMLALGACTDTKRVPVGDPMADEKLKKETDRANAAQAALNDLRDSLADVQNALKPDPSATPEQQRENLRKRLTDVETNLGMVQENLQKQPASAARTAVDTALTAVGTAVEAVKTALAPTPASGGTVSFADMHMDLDAAQAALDDAQTKITAALGADGLTDTLQTALTQAQAALTTAQVSLVPRLRSELMQAEDDAAAQKARADAEKERADAEKARADTYDPRVTLGDRLTPVAPGGTQVNRGGTNADFTYMERTSHTAKTAPTAPAAPADPSNPTAEERALLDAYADKFMYTDPLEIKDEGVLYTDGKMVVGGAGGDELMLRGTVLRDTLRVSTTNRPTVGPTNKGLTILGHDERPLSTNAEWYNWRFPLKSSIKLPTDPAKGPTFEMGGPGVISYDLEQRTRASGGFCPDGQTGDTRTHCDDATTDDVRVAFTSQAVQDPTGDAAYYWQTNIPFDTTGRNSALFSTVKKGDDIVFGVSDAANRCAVIAATAMTGCTGTADRAGVLGTAAAGDKADRQVFMDGATPQARPLYDTPRLTCTHNWCNEKDPRDYGRPFDQGQYRAWLSNYAGENSYLKYAAYGLFQSFGSSANYAGPGRSQAFHFGYDAYAHDPEASNNPNAVPTTGDPISATFKGATTGWLLRTGRPGGTADAEVFSTSHRLRGSVELTAKIGGTGSDTNTITGSMSDFEIFDNGIWSNRLSSFRILSPGADGVGVSLTAGVIAADGTYKGTAEAPSGQFSAGAFEGAFYGPEDLGELETAGSWYLPPSATLYNGLELGTVLGSFGARSEPPATE